jgi:hypothetical protein
MFNQLTQLPEITPLWVYNFREVPQSQILG